MLVDRVEYLGVQVGPVQRLERVVELGVLAVGLSPDDRNTHEIDVRRFFGLPGFERRIERVAVAAAVPEDFVDLDPASGHAGGLWAARSW